MSKVCKSSSGFVARDSLDVNQLFFANLSLLGFDAVAMERKHRIPFNRLVYFILFITVQNRDVKTGLFL